MIDQLKTRLVAHTHKGFEYSEHACALGYAIHELGPIGHMLGSSTILFYTSAGLLGYALIGLTTRIAHAVVVATSSRKAVRS